MTAFNPKEFKPTIIFLTKFIGLYFALSLVYGFYIRSYDHKPDAATLWITNQSSQLITLAGWKTQTWNHPKKPTTSIAYKGNGIVSVYEGCNGINVAIIFLSFLLSFGPVGKRLAWFAPVGLILIHIVNLGRIIGLFFVVLYMPSAVYFSHKYLFTAIIYAVVFILWLIWLRVNFLKKSLWLRSS
jgi:exosortase family protein XrtF